jgi:hypothetical protein
MFSNQIVMESSGYNSQPETFQSVVGLRGYFVEIPMPIHKYSISLALRSLPY